MSKKAVLISIKPKWCGKIFSGEKNLEFRKTKPRIETSFKCYVYCTAKKERPLEIIKDGDDVYGVEYHGKPIFIKMPDHGYDVDAVIHGWEKKVIGEITVDRIEEITVVEWRNVPTAVYGGIPFTDYPDGYLLSGGIKLGEYLKYKGDGKVYGWHISDCTLYDKPKDLSGLCYTTDSIERRLRGKMWTTMEALNGDVKIPPQSWCYVEDLWQKD